MWHAIKERTDDIIVADWPQTNTFNNEVLTDFEVAAEVISRIRNIRKQKNIANKEVLDFSVKTNVLLNTAFDSVIAKLGNLSSINYVDEKIEGAFSFLVKSNEYFIPLGASIDVEAELDKLQKQLNYTKEFLKSVEGKLKNERFVNNAPEQVVAVERKKQADALSKITVLQEQIATLS